MMDGPFPSIIDAFERIDPTHYCFRTTAGYLDIQQVDVYIVDPVRKIAVFAFSGEEPEIPGTSVFMPRLKQSAKWILSNGISRSRPTETKSIGTSLITRP